MRQSRPMRTCSPMTACGPTTVPAPSTASGCTIALASTVTPARVAPGLVGDQAHQELGLGGDVVADVGDRMRAREPRPPRPHRDLEPQPVARDDRQPELGAVHAAQIRVRPGLSGCVSRIVATCASVSIMSTPGISGAPGKCPWKNSSLTVTFLTATTRRPGSCSVTASTSGDG